MKTMVEKRMCDTKSCGSGADEAPCPLCGADVCWQHQGVLQLQSSVLSICAKCFHDRFPEFHEKAAEGSSTPFTDYLSRMGRKTQSFSDIL